MKICRIELRGVRGLPDASFDTVDPRTGRPHRLVLVTGPSASGKTRLLEAILAAKELIAPYAAPPETSPWIRPGAGSARVGLLLELDDAERAWGGLDTNTVPAEAVFQHKGGFPPEDDGVTAVLRRYEHGDDTGKFEYFPANRSIPANGLGLGLTPFQQRSVRATGDARKYACLTRVVYELSTGGGARASRFAEALARLSPTCRFEPTPSASALPPCFPGRDGPRTLNELSASEIDAVIFAATASLIGLSRSIVLVDTPELHADPEAVPALLEGLLSLGEDVQVIAATRAPALLHAAQPGQVIELGRVRP